ncbi:MAG TPA: alpha/beta fold hydrolase, partial [Puia sp.]|nr:alpha/beta fold hydrolase [Puia sp.]
MLFLWIIASIGFSAHDTQIEKMVFKSNSTQLTGFLYKPVGPKKFPVVLIAHAAGLPLHDAPIYIDLEKNLNKIGVAVFSYDRRGNGLSGGDPKSSDFNLLAGDLNAAIVALKRREDIDSTMIGLYGISQGAWIAPIAYSQNKSAIQFMILVSACGVSPAEQMKYSMKTALKKDGYPDSIIQKGVKTRNLLDDYYRGKLQKWEVQAEIDYAKNKPWFGDLYLPNGGQLPESPCDTKWFHDMDFRPADYFKQINIHVLLIYGQRDRWVPINKSITVWQEQHADMQNR